MLAIRSLLLGVCIAIFKNPHGRLLMYSSEKFRVINLRIFETKRQSKSHRKVAFKSKALQHMAQLKAF